MGNPVVHFEIGGRDRAKLGAFYGELFDWSIAEGEFASTIDTGVATSPTGHLTALGHEPHLYTMFYVQVDDIGRSLASVERLGGSVLVGPLPIPEGTFAWIKDPEGNTVGLLEPGSNS